MALLALLPEWRADVRGLWWVLRERDSMFLGAILLGGWGRTGAPSTHPRHPAPDPNASYQCTFHTDRVSFEAAWPQLRTTTTVWVSPEDDVELRKVVLVNRSEHPIDLELISALEVTLEDVQGKPLVRRVFGADQLGAPETLSPGQVWQGLMRLTVARDLAARLAAMPRHATAELKASLASAERASLAEQLQYEAERQRELIAASAAAGSEADAMRAAWRHRYQARPQPPDGDSSIGRTSHSMSHSSPSFSAARWTKWASRVTPSEVLPVCSTA